jgi:oxygen-independent coproporphyrinogen-3 oxidase
MNIALYTPVPELAAEMADVLRLFYGEIGFSVNSGGTEADICLRHELTVMDGSWDCAFFLSGKTVRQTAPVTLGEDNALLQKRLRKRLCKQALYTLLKAETGIHPPWGSLTGIRPTRLVYEAMRGGLSSPEAAKQVETAFDLHHDKAMLLSDIVNVQLTMPPPDLTAVDVYIGIPFCRTRCAYCSFLSGELGKGLQVEPYLNALIREMAFTYLLIKDAGLELRAVYMGGGTPTAIPESAFRRVIEAMASYFPHAVEYTVEAGRPDSISREKLKVIQEAGVRRISINPQSMRAETLKRIGRDHTPEQTVEAYELAREMGFSSINMDLIAGLPGETAADFEYTLSWARRLMPESLTIHTLALKRASLLRLWESPLPDGEETARMVLLGADAAREMGLKPYYLYRQKYMAGNQENVGYALPGHECLYNVDIMEETESILAVGAGAISKRVFGGEGRIERAPNVSNIGVYMERLDEMLKRKAGLFSFY